MWIVSSAYAYLAKKADTANYALSGASDNAWVGGTPDSVLYTIRRLGIARGEANNMLYGNSRYTHTNLGISCTTGTSGEDNAYCTVVGGANNTASGNRSTVAGGFVDTSAGSYSFTTNYHSVLPSSYSNSAAFNGEVATASTQTRGVLSKASGSFTIDHPLDAYHKILNHYFIEGPEMRNLYDGKVILDASGRATLHLPDYFNALNRKPRIQLTGVGISDVYVAEDIRVNIFVIGGKPGTKVYWQVTGERQDVSVAVTRRMMPVEPLRPVNLRVGCWMTNSLLAVCYNWSRKAKHLVLTSALLPVERVTNR